MIRSSSQKKVTMTAIRSAGHQKQRGRPRDAACLFVKKSNLARRLPQVISMWYDIKVDAGLSLIFKGTKMPQAAQAWSLPEPWFIYTVIIVLFLALAIALGAVARRLGAEGNKWSL